MTSDELVDAFRLDVVDTAKPYLWSDDEVYRYAGDAYTMFVRQTGGIYDFTSDAASVSIVTGEALGELHPSILRIMKAVRRSDNADIEVINPTDTSRFTSSDYGRTRKLVNDSTPGPVRYMLLGAQKGVVRWINVPVVDDVVDLVIRRLPLTRVTGPGQSLSEVDEIHHLHLLNWMKHLAYKKADADTFNPKGSVAAQEDFMAYCSLVKAENERYKHKTRVVKYGGL